jgi:tetratricopeptide (TPR) repeat protein
MKLTIFIVSLIVLSNISSCNSSNDKKSELVDPSEKVIDLNESLAYIDRLLEKDPVSPEILFKKAETLFNLQYYDQASETLTRIEKPFNDERYELLEIQLNLQNNKIEEALTSAEYLYNVKGLESIILNEQLAHLYSRKKDYLKAIDHINYCIYKNPDNPKYSYLKGLYYYNFRDTLNAYNHIEKALENGYKEMNGIVLYSDLLMASNKPDEAFELINDNLTEDPYNQSLKNALAKVHNIKRDFNKSKEISFKIINADYQGFEPYLNLADVYLDTYRYDSAIYFAEKALMIDNQINQGYYILGKAHRAKEQVYNAYNAYSKVLEYDPGDPYALAEMRKLENYIAYLQRIKREYESRPVLPTLKPKSIENR